MKKNYKSFRPFIMTVLSTANAAFDAPNTTGTVTSAAGAATLSKDAGKVTTEALTTAALTDYTLTITNTTVTANSRITATINRYSGTTGTPLLARATPGAGSIVVIVRNQHATEALNGVLDISFAVGQPIV